MTTTLIEALALATGGLFSIGSVMAVILFLSSKRGLQKALSYYLGYTGVYFFMALALLLLGKEFIIENGNSTENSRLWAGVMIAMGSLLLIFALKQWLTPESKGPEIKKWLDRLNSLSPLQTFLFGAVIPFINIKKLPIFFSAVSVIIEGELSLYQELASITAITALFNAGIGSPIVVYLVFGSRAGAWLEAFRQGLDRHNRPVSIAVMIVFGAIFILRGVLRMV